MPHPASGPLLLDVVVTDKSNKPVAGLQQQDFTVLDDKQPARILSFHGPSTPPPGMVNASSVVILILDEVNTPFDKAVYAREGLQNYLRQNHGQLDHPVQLGLFTDKGLQLQTQASTDGSAMADALEKQGNVFRAMDRGTGFYGDEERLQKSQNAVDSLIAQEKSQPGPKMVIWISPGWPLLSGPRSSISSGQMQQVFGTVVHLSTALRAARMTFYSVDPLGEEGVGGNRTTFYENFTKGLVKPDQAELGDIGLQVLATQTGGRAIFGDATIASSIDHCVADLDALYTLSIDAVRSERPNDFHTLEVRVARPGLKVRTRNGYYAQP